MSLSLLRCVYILIYCMSVCCTEFAVPCPHASRILENPRNIWIILDQHTFKTYTAAGSPRAYALTTQPWKERVLTSPIQCLLIFKSRRGFCGFLSFLMLARHGWRRFLNVVTPRRGVKSIQPSVNDFTLDLTIKKRFKRNALRPSLWRDASSSQLESPCELQMWMRHNSNRS